MKVQRDSDSSARVDSDFEVDDRSNLTRPTVSEEAEKNYIDSYFQYFHHRWPIVHRPSYKGSDQRLPLLCAMSMIGAWEFGSGGSRMYSMVMHDYLMARIPPLLVSNRFYYLKIILTEKYQQKKTSKDRFQGTLPTALCQAALLLVINSFTCGVSTPEM
jgi:hypothetical protein